MSVDASFSQDAVADVPARIDTQRQALQLAKTIVRECSPPVPANAEAARFLAHQMLADHVIEVQRLEMERLQEEVRKMGQAAGSPGPRHVETPAPPSVPVVEEAPPAYSEMMVAPDSGLYEEAPRCVSAAVASQEEDAPCATPQQPVSRSRDESRRGSVVAAESAAMHPHGGTPDEVRRVVMENARLREEIALLRRQLGQGSRRGSAVAESISTEPPAPFQGRPQPPNDDIDWEAACGKVIDVVKGARERQQEADYRVSELEGMLQDMQASQGPLQSIDAAVFDSPVSPVPLIAAADECWTREAVEDPAQDAGESPVAEAEPEAVAPRGSFARPPPEGSELPPGWREYLNEAGRPYYHNASTKHTQWRRPSGASQPPPPDSAAGSRRSSRTGRQPSAPALSRQPSAAAASRQPSAVSRRASSPAAQPLQEEAPRQPTEEMQQPGSTESYIVGKGVPAETVREGLALLRCSSPRSRMRGLSLLRGADEPRAAEAADAAADTPLPPSVPPSAAPSRKPSVDPAAFVPREPDVDGLRRRLLAAEESEALLSANRSELEREKADLERQLASLRDESSSQRAEAERLTELLRARDQEIGDLRKTAEQQPPPPPPPPPPDAPEEGSPLIRPPMNSVTTVTVEQAQPAGGALSIAHSSPTRVAVRTVPLADSLSPPYDVHLQGRTDISPARSPVGVSLKGCVACGTGLVAGATYCHNCGWRSAASLQAAQRPLF